MATSVKLAAETTEAHAAAKATTAMVPDHPR